MFTTSPSKYASIAKRNQLSESLNLLQPAVIMGLRHILFNQVLIAFLMFFTVIVSCTRSDRDEDTETLAARDYALAHHIFDDAFRQVHKYAMGDTILNDTSITQQKWDVCLNRRFSYLSDTLPIFPMFLQLNYADDGKLCNDSAVRYGIIRADFTGKYLNQGTAITITFEGYRNAIYDVEGTVTIINNGINNDGRRYYSFIVEDGLVTSNNVNIEFDGTFQYVWVAGSSTDVEFDDDVFEITEGVTIGRNSRGSSFTNEITTAYTSSLSCPHFTSGRSALEVQNLIPRTLNYGDITDCDNVLISRRNNTYLEVEIPIMQP